MPWSIWIWTCVVRYVAANKILYPRYITSYLSAYTVYPKKYAHGFVVLCFVVVMQSFIMNSHEVFVHIHQGCFAGTGAIVRLPQCQWSKPGGYGIISQCITTIKHNKAKTVCIFLGIYCILALLRKVYFFTRMQYYCFALWYWLKRQTHILLIDIIVLPPPPYTPLPTTTPPLEMWLIVGIMNMNQLVLSNNHFE